jgi:hypothetical protein
MTSDPSDPSGTYPDFIRGFTIPSSHHFVFIRAAPPARGQFVCGHVVVPEDLAERARSPCGGESREKTSSLIRPDHDFDGKILLDHHQPRVSTPR